MGLALRLIEYLRQDSISGDEAMLVLNIASRPLRELVPPLAYGQVAPAPFLWAERLMVMLFGVNEWALRAVPFTAGCALCVGVALLARRMLSSGEALVAAVLVAFSQTLIQYSAEVKPYAWDALVTVAMAGTALGVLRRMNSGRSWGLVAAMGTIAILASLTSPFICLGVGIGLGMQAVKDKRADLLLRTMLMGLAWTGLFTFTYFQVYQRGAGSQYMRSFWEGAFLVPGSPNLLARTRIALREVLWGIDSGMAVLGLGALTAVLTLLGAITLCRRGRPAYALLLAVPGIAPFVASALGVYPIARRLMVFASPLFIILAAVGLVTVARTVHGLAPRVPTRWLAAFLVLPSVITGLTWALWRERDLQLVPLLQNLTERWDPGEAIYVYHRIVPTWLYYSTNWVRPSSRQLAWAMGVSGPGGLGHENGPTRGPRPPGEGSELVYRLKGHTVLLGTSSGVQGRPMFGYLPRQPDPGWAANESLRIRRAANPRIWIMIGHASHDGMDLGEMLLNAVRDQGGILVSRDARTDWALYHFEFPSGTSPPPA